jgi:hypothetical protein
MATHTNIPLTTLPGVREAMKNIKQDGGTLETPASCYYEDLIKVLQLNPSLVIIPNAFKEGKLYSTIPGALGDLNVVRATTKTRTNSLGVIENVPINVPALDYTNGSCPSWSVEPQRTNLLFPSDVATTQTRTVSAVAHTLSFYGTGSVVLSGVVIGTLSGTGVNNRVTLTFTPTAGSLILTVTGSVTDWQLEVGSNATSYIPTVASAVTRNADVISKTGIYTNNFISVNGGTWFVNLKDWKIGDSNTASISIADTSISTNNTINIIGGTLRTRINSAVSNSYSTLPSRAKIAIKWDGTFINYFVNGVKVLTDGAFNITNMNFLNISGSNAIRNIENISLFPNPLTDQECINLTTL